jgi:peptidoglycan hydrolase-like protein with peptidoglycan-binding domain
MSKAVLRLFDGYEHTNSDLSEEVKELQNALRKNGFPSVQADGKFGPGTDAAVRTFQKKQKIPADGIVGTVTWARLLGQKPERRGALSTSYDAHSAALLAENREAEKFREAIEAAAKKHKIFSALLVGIGSRESAWGAALKPKGPSGTGDFYARPAPGKFRTGSLPPEGGFGRGLMQIDFDAHEFARTGEWWEPTANIAALRGWRWKAAH